jgi:hypothetical protein
VGLGRCAGRRCRCAGRRCRLRGPALPVARAGAAGAIIRRGLTSEEPRRSEEAADPDVG